MSTSDPLLKRLARELDPPAGSRERIRKQISARIAAPVVLQEVYKALSPSRSTQQRVWQQVLGRIECAQSQAFLERLRILLTPPKDINLTLRSYVIPRLQPARASFSGQWAFKWVAAFVVFALLVKSGPQLFLAPSTVADSAVTLLPTRGEVAISVGGFWQPVDAEIRLEPGMMLRTYDGEASILLRDDGVIRLGTHTTVQLHNTNDPTSTEPAFGPTLTLFTGQIWVQGLIPEPLRGLEIKTEYGRVMVQEGSVSIMENTDVDVLTWHRRAQVTQRSETVYLVGGERTRLTEQGVLVVKKIGDEQYEDDWVTQNLERDAVHRKAIAQLQQERRAARAGILPTSPLYPVKRMAETMDVLLTFNEEARTQKRLDQANVRLNEATALLQEGDVEAVRIPLEEYRDSLLAVAGASDDVALQLLISQALAEATGEVSAVLPDDHAYIIKEAVLEASAAVPDGTVSQSDVQGVLLVDTITALLQQVDLQGVSDTTVRIWSDLQGQLSVLDDETSPLRPEVRKEAQVLLSELAFTIVNQQEKNGIAEPLLITEVAAYLPPDVQTIPILTEEEIMTIVQGIKDRIFVYSMQRSRINQLNAEFKSLEGHPDQGRILRRLYFALPGGPEDFPLRVRKEIIRLQWQRAGQ